MPSFYDRPKITVDPWGFALSDPTTGAVVGRAAPLGRERIVSALRLNEGARVLEPPRIVVDAWGFALSCPVTGAIVGSRGIRVQRMLSAGHAADTRRL